MSTHSMMNVSLYMIVIVEPDIVKDSDPLNK